MLASWKQLFTVPLTTYKSNESDTISSRTREKDMHKGKIFIQQFSRIRKLADVVERASERASVQHYLFIAVHELFNIRIHIIRMVCTFVVYNTPLPVSALFDPNWKPTLINYLKIVYTNYALNGWRGGKPKNQNWREKKINKSINIRAFATTSFSVTVRLCRSCSLHAKHLINNIANSGGLIITTLVLIPRNYIKRFDKCFKCFEYTCLLCCMRCMQSTKQEHQHTPSTKYHHIAYHHIAFVRCHTFKYIQWLIYTHGVRSR